MTKSECIAIDAGNSRIKIGRFARRDALLPVCEESAVFLIADKAGWSSAVADLVARTADPIGIVAGSNQPGVDRVVAAWPSAETEPMVVRSSERFPIRIDVDEPQRVGLDRILNAIAANRMRDEDHSAIIVDCGTATTVDLVSREGAFAGGAILPGFGLAARALNEYTEALPLVSFYELAEQVDVAQPEPGGPSALGRNTRAAIHSGVFWGQVGAIRELVARLTQTGDSAKVILTGGGSSALAPFLPEAVHCPLLSLQGLVIVAGQNV